MRRLLGPAYGGLVAYLASRYAHERPGRLDAQVDWDAVLKSLARLEEDSEMLGRRQHTLEERIHLFESLAQRSFAVSYLTLLAAPGGGTKPGLSE
jgi:hypothetical protein